MRIIIPKFSTKKDLFSYLKENEKDLMAKKKSLPIKSDSFIYGCDDLEYPTEDILNTKSVSGASVKANGSLNDGEVSVKVVANLHGWCDSHMDVLLNGSAKKTLNDKGASNQRLIYHLKDHNHSTEGIIGKEANAYTEFMNLNKFNINSDIKQAEALIGSSIVKRSYDAKVFELYSDNMIKQHSIGLQYVKMFLCIDSQEAEDAQYKDNFDKYLSQVINKEKVQKAGYYWAVSEYKLLEYSAVLWGASEMTPTQEVGKNIQPSGDTGKKESQKSTHEVKPNKLRLI